MKYLWWSGHASVVERQDGRHGYGGCDDGDCDFELEAFLLEGAHEAYDTCGDWSVGWFEVVADSEICVPCLAAEYSGAPADARYPAKLAVSTICPPSLFLRR